MTVHVFPFLFSGKITLSHQGQKNEIQKRFIKRNFRIFRFRDFQLLFLFSFTEVIIIEVYQSDFTLKISKRIAYSFFMSLELLLGV